MLAFYNYAKDFVRYAHNHNYKHVEYNLHTRA